MSSFFTLIIDLFKFLITALVGIFILLYRFCVASIGFIHAIFSGPSEDEIFIKNTYANMSDQELYQEYQNIKTDLLKLQNLRHSQDAQNMYMLMRSGFFTSAYIAAKDYRSANNYDSLKFQLEYQLK